MWVFRGLTCYEGRGGGLLGQIHRSPGNDGCWLTVLKSADVRFGGYNGVLMMLDAGNLMAPGPLGLLERVDPSCPVKYPSMSAWFISGAMGCIGEV